DVTFFLELINGDASLFSSEEGVNAVELSSTGNLTFTLSPSANGNATFSVTMVDSGGTARGGEDTAVVKNLTIIVASVNDRPAFVVGDVTVYQAQGNVTIPDFASGIARGDNGNEADQRLSFSVTFVSGNADLFFPDENDVGISPDGTLSFTLDPLHRGSATFNVTLEDEGGVMRGGENAAEVQEFTVTVIPVNRAPEVVVPENDDAPSEAVSIADFATGIHPGNENGNEDHQSLTFHVSLLSGNAGLFISPDGTPPVSLDLDGSLKFTLGRYAYGEVCS
ncbi:hypothetical protein T484DRAFT_1760076, partial [Baffinella frigidus]